MYKSGSIPKLVAPKKHNTNLLCRSNHTMITMTDKQKRMKNGYKLVFYKSYIFGGLIQLPDGRTQVTNDFIEVTSKTPKLDQS